MAGRTRTQHFITATVICGVLLAASGCGLRWETEPSPVPVADQTTRERDALAAAVETVMMMAATRSDSAGPAATEIASAQLDALGGVYVAYPDAEVTPDPSPSPPPTYADAVAALRTTARDIAAQTSDANLAAIATSIDLAWALRGAWDELAVESPEMPAADAGDILDGGDGATGGADAGEWLSEALPLPDGTRSEAGFAPVLDTQLSAAGLAELALMHDHARFAYETAAAQVFAHERDEALRRSRAHGERSDALQAATTAPDERTTLYQLRDVNLADADARRALFIRIEHDLAVRYAALAVTATGSDREWLLNAAYASSLAVFTLGAGDDLVTALPGLTVSAQ